MLLLFVPFSLMNRDQLSGLKGADGLGSSVVQQGACCGWPVGLVCVCAAHVLIDVCGALLLVLIFCSLLGCSFVVYVSLLSVVFTFWVFGWSVWFVMMIWFDCVALRRLCCTLAAVDVSIVSLMSLTSCSASDMMCMALLIAGCVPI